MLNEWEEFSAYTVFPEYKKDSYLGRFTLPMLLDIWVGALNGKLIEKRYSMG